MPIDTLNRERRERWSSHFRARLASRVHLIASSNLSPSQAHSRQRRTSWFDEVCFSFAPRRASSLIMVAFLQLLFLSLAIGALGQDTTPSGPTQPGTASNCNKWYTVKAGDGCYSVETAFGITHTQFIDWNPAVSNDCTTNFWAGYSYCIGVGSVITSSSFSTTGTTTTPVTNSSSPITTTASVNATYSIRNPITSYTLSTPTTDRTWPPTKTQAGQPSYCNKWYLVGAGDTCEIVYRKFGTSMSRENL